MKRPETLGWVSLLLLGAALAGLAYLGTFTRFHADDFCMAADARSLGLAGLLAKWYTGWTGRFSYLLVRGLLGLGGPALASAGPALLIAAWLAALSWALFPLAKRLVLSKPALKATLTAGLILVTLFSALPNLFQSLFWQDGMANYAIPLPLLTLNLGLILRAWLEKPRRFAPAEAGLLALFSGGFAEAFSAFQVAVFVLALLATLPAPKSENRRALRAMLSAALAGSLLALLLVVLAPGNLIRQEVAGQSSAFGHIVLFSMRNATYIIGKFILRTPIWAAASAIPAFLGGWALSADREQGPKRLTLRGLVHLNWFGACWKTLLATFVLVSAACAPVAYAFNAYPDDRALIVPLFAVVTGAMASSFSLAMALGQAGWLPHAFAHTSLPATLRTAGLAVVMAAALLCLVRVQSQVPEYRAYAASWDRRSAVLLQAGSLGATSATVPGLSARFGLADLNASPDFWVNRCMASYYHLSELRGR